MTRLPAIRKWDGKAPERPRSVRSPAMRRSVANILAAVRKEGDAAVARFTSQFDGRTLLESRVAPSRFEEAFALVGADGVADLRAAIENISRFHQHEVPAAFSCETMPGVRCERRFLPISRVGLYVPGGSAPLPSTAMMLGVPSQIAGCSLRVLVSPPPIAPAILVVASLLGISEVHEIGGAQAIGALAFGTERVSKVDKIFGPGNAWVTEAKLQASLDPRGAAYDLPAGPSEVMVLCDRSADPDFVAADLLSQAEHGPDSQVVVVSHDAAMLRAVRRAVVRQLALLPRQQIAAAALRHSMFLLVAERSDLIRVANAYAPEHLILQVRDPAALADEVVDAGSVFLGPWTPESMGDYASGTNHVLPTYGFARAYSGLGVEQFMKSITFQEVTRAGLQRLGPLVERLAAMEGLTAHAAAVRVRLEKGGPP